MIWEEPLRLLSEKEVEAIRAGVREGLRGPALSKWVAQLLADHDMRVRIEGERDEVSE